mmetsp:Transcript_289/g.685  ORF Transcript_289/g.685 Transcript_289/m.685 type:complete len:274 (+) Transcript_289:215-1036(+)
MRQHHKDDAGGGDEAWNLRIRPTIERPSHHDAVYNATHKEMIELLDPKDTSEVWLPRLRKGDEVAIVEAAHREIDEHERGDGRAKRTENNADHKVDRETTAASPNTVVVLILRLRHLCGILIRVQTSEGQVLDEIHVSRQVQRMGHPLEDNEVHVEVGTSRQFIPEQGADGDGIREYMAGELYDRGADRSHHDHEDHLEAEIPILKLMLSPSVVPEYEEALEDQDQQGRQEVDHYCQAHGWCDARPIGLQGPHVNRDSYSCDPDHRRHVDKVE